MIEVLQFIFQSFWHWLGTLILISVTGGCLVGAAAAIRKGTT